MKISNIVIGMFIAITSGIVGLLATTSMAQGIQGMGYVLTGCVACFVGGLAVIAMEFSNE
jgi:hypothetical protein